MEFARIGGMAAWYQSGVRPLQRNESVSGTFKHHDCLYAVHDGTNKRTNSELQTRTMQSR